MNKKSKRLLVGATVAVVLIGSAGVGVYYYNSKPIEKLNVKSSGKILTATSTVGKPVVDQNSEPAIDLTTYKNDRYGFSIGYPKDWQATQGQNGDGATFADPAYTQLTMRVYGSMTTVYSMSEVVASREASYKENYSDVKRVEEKEIIIDDHPAVTVVWEYTKDGPVREKTLLTFKGDAIISAEVAIPADRYDSYIPAINAMFNSLKVK